MRTATLRMSGVDWAEYRLGLALVPVAAYFLVVPFGAGGAIGLPWLLVHSLDLIAHEAGHAVFSWAGDWWHAAGGSILQLALPALFVWQGAMWSHRAGTQVALLWLGQNLVDVSVYAADAAVRQLPLLGGLGDENHDWWWMLIRLGKLAWADEIALAMVAAAVVCWAVMVALPRWML